MNDSIMIGIDIGGTFFRIGQVSESGDLLDFRKVLAAEVIGKQDPLADLGSYVSEYLKETPESRGTIAGLTIGFPGVVDKERKVLVQSPNLKFPENLPVVDVLTAELKIPVFIANDVELALLSDMDRLGISSEGVITGFYFGTGIGNAIMIDGRLLSGKNGASGELGHIPVDGSSVVCGCGNTGCLENLAGGKYLAKLCSETFTDIDISDLFTKRGDDPLLEQFVDRMAMAVATEVNILDPDHVLIGGGVTKMKDFPEEALLDKVILHTRKPFPAENLQVTFTGDSPEKCVLGGALYGFARLEGRI